MTNDANRAGMEQLKTKLDLMKEFYGLLLESQEVETNNRKREDRIHTKGITELIGLEE